MKAFGIAILSITAFAVLMLVVFPVAASQILRLMIHGADTHRMLVRPGFLSPLVSNPLVSLLAALLMLLAFGWGIWKLSR